LNGSFYTTGQPGENGVNECRKQCDIAAECQGISYNVDYGAPAKVPGHFIKWCFGCSDDVQSAVREWGKTWVHERKKDLFFQSHVLIYGSGSAAATTYDTYYLRTLLLLPTILILN
jgi:hypothetical protein